MRFLGLGSLCFSLGRSSPMDSPKFLDLGSSCLVPVALPNISPRFIGLGTQCLVPVAPHPFKRGRAGIFNLKCCTKLFTWFAQIFVHLCAMLLACLHKFNQIMASMFVHVHANNAYILAQLFVHQRAICVDSCACANRFLYLHNNLCILLQLC